MSSAETRRRQQALSFELVGRIEDGADAPPDGFTLIEPGDVALRVLLQVKLAALPGRAGQRGATWGFEAGVMVNGVRLD